MLIQFPSKCFKNLLPWVCTWAVPVLHVGCPLYMLTHYRFALTGFMQYFICRAVLKKVDVIYISFLLSYHIELQKKMYALIKFSDHILS